LRILKQTRVIFLTGVLLTFAPWGAGAASDQLTYAASISFLQAGTISMRRSFGPDGYELVGDVATSAMLKPLYSWTGHFAAHGRWDSGEPESRAYFLDSTGRKGRRSLLLLNGDVTRLYSSRRGWKELPAPDGVDLMSVLFANTGCFHGDTVHDGEDSYRIRLTGQKQDRLSASSRYYSGPALRCHYEGQDLRGRERDVTVWLATPIGFSAPVPVRIVVAIPRAPDGILQLELGQGD
jgi:hypothetical protein